MHLGNPDREVRQDLEEREHKACRGHRPHGKRHDALLAHGLDRELEGDTARGDARRVTQHELGARHDSWFDMHDLKSFLSSHPTTLGQKFARPVSWLAVHGLRPSALRPC